MARCASVNIDAKKPDRTCGFLTETEREYLMGEWSSDKKSHENAKRHDIRTRTRHALADLALIQECADEQLKSQIVEANADPKIFDEQITDEFMQGMLRFAMEATTTEAFTSALFDELESDQISERIQELLLMSLQGDKEGMMSAIIDMMDDMDATKRDMMEAKGYY